MRSARPLGLTPDGKSLIVVLDGGEQVTVPADERLRAALRDDRPRMGQLEIDMDSALRPRDIQARIRSGESLEQVALAAGVPVEQIEPFAGPVIAEREHIAGLAESGPVRRAGDAVAHRSLRAVVSDRLLSRGVDVDSVRWDAWRTGDRRWNIRLSYESGKSEREADFTYDQTGRFSVAANDDARWLTGEQTPKHGPQPGRRPRGGDADDEVTADLNDELALIRAIQPVFSVTPDVDEDGPDNDDAYSEVELAEVDGLYDLVPGDRSNLDVLYDMLSSFDEDSVQVYAGLVRPPGESGVGSPVLDDGPVGADDAHVVEDHTVEINALEEDSEAEDEDAPPADSGAAQKGLEQVPPDPDRPEHSEPTHGAADPVEPPPTRRPARKPAQEPVSEPEQPSLVDEIPPEPTRPIKRKRASVPSWDEIMFGSPQQRK